MVAWAARQGQLSSCEHVRLGLFSLFTALNKYECSSSCWCRTSQQCLLLCSLLCNMFMPIHVCVVAWRTQAVLYKGSVQVSTRVVSMLARTAREWMRDPKARQNSAYTKRRAAVFH